AADPPQEGGAPGARGGCGVRDRRWRPGPDDRSAHPGRLRGRCRVPALIEMNEPTRGAFVAVDLGASSGRVIRGEVVAGEVTLTEVARFPNGATPDESGTLRWDLSGLVQAILEGLRAA